MQFSTKTRYSLRALTYLAAKSQGNPIFLKEIAKTEGLPIKYLESLFHTLKKQGLLISIRGAKGGYILAKKPEDINILDILEVFDGKFNLVDCNKKNKCQKINMCSTKNIYTEITEQFKVILKNYNLKMLTKMYMENKNLNMMYYI